MLRRLLKLYSEPATAYFTLHFILPLPCNLKAGLILITNNSRFSGVFSQSCSHYIWRETGNEVSAASKDGNTAKIFSDEDDFSSRLVLINKN